MLWEISYTSIHVLYYRTYCFISAEETRNVTYCELYTHTFVNVSNPYGNIIVTRTQADDDTYYRQVQSMNAIYLTDI